MPDRVKEKLVELLCHEYEYETYEDMADGMIAHGVTVHEWISVKDRLPKSGEEVITYRQSGMNVENRFGKDWCFDEFSDCPVTHWMPLPQPPKGE